MSRLRIGIDVGGTNTDAVLVDDHDTVLAAEKTPPPRNHSTASAPC